tara:strand:+ start:802 stop:1038 length:237 start_codon:yes stop_codon:yes gene_type:complete
MYTPLSSTIADPKESLQALFHIARTPEFDNDRLSRQECGTHQSATIAVPTVHDRVIISSAHSLKMATHEVFDFFRHRH